MLLALFATMGMFVVPTAARAASPTIRRFTATVSDTNKVTLDWQVSGGDSSKKLFIYDVGFRDQACPSRQPVGCSTSLRVVSGGIKRYTLLVPNDAMQFATSTIEVLVRPLTPPTTPSSRVDVDMLDIRPQTLSWTHGGSGFVEISQLGSPRGYGTELPATGTFTVGTTSLPIGSSTFHVSYCERPAINETTICSSGTPVTFVVGPARFSGPYRKFVPVNQNLKLSWSGSGNAWYLSAPTLGVATWLERPSYTVPAASVTAGVHAISVVNCSFTASAAECSNRVDAIAPVAGTLEFTVANGTAVHANDPVATLRPDGGGTAKTLTARRAGTFWRIVANGAHVGAHARTGVVLTADAGHTEVVVGGGASVPTWTTEDWDTAFTATTYDNWVRPLTGNALDVTFDSTGDIWQVGEFSTAIAHVQNGNLTDHLSPITGNWNQARGIYEPVRPYAMSLFGADFSTSTSVLGERVIDTGSAVWYTQGGGFFYNGAHSNHSSLIKFDRSGTDDPTTPDDERLCAVHVPGDNNQVIGIAYDPATNRVWFTESRVGHPSALGWFVDDGSIGCDNDLDYSDQSAVDAASAANHCTSATQTGCIHEIDLPRSAGVAGHITIDASSGSAWFVDYTGRVLDRYPLAGGAVQSFPLPASVERFAFGGFPWQVRADASAVYVNEWSDNQLVRFDKTVPNPTTACATLTNGKNPCMSELFLPMLGPDVNAHSIALVGGRLWFTIANVSDGPTDPNGSTFGYVDTTSWAAGAPMGVLYDNLTTLGTPRPNDHHSFCGLDVTAAGRVALADMGYDEVVSLAPK